MDEAPDEYRTRRVAVGRWTPQGWQITTDPAFAQPERTPRRVFCNHYCWKHHKSCGKFRNHEGAHDCGC